MNAIVATLLLSVPVAVAIGAPAQPRQSVVELFTSEGCSSCPPAEAYLGELAQRPDVLALAFHVDYWDDLGWRDQFVIPEATPRQRGYARALRLSSVYTPQMIVDGTANLVGSDRVRIYSALKEPRTGVPVEIASHDGALSIGVSADDSARPSDVLMIAFEQSAVSPIGRGENAGHTLTEYNIVRAIRRLGAYEGRAQTYHADLKSLPREVTEVAVIVQALGQGPVAGVGRYVLHPGD